MLHQTYLPHQTPALLNKYREEELEILRGKGKEDVMLKEHDRVYDYAYYNDLGNSERGPEYARPVFGGSAEYPYPRRGRTSRPPLKTGYLTFIFPWPRPCFSLFTIEDLKRYEVVLCFNSIIFLQILSLKAGCR